MRKITKIKLLDFLVKTEGAFFLVPPLLFFLAGAPLLFTAASSVIAIASFALCRASRNHLREALRKLNRSPLQSFIEDSGLPETEARRAWNEIDAGM